MQLRDAAGTLAFELRVKHYSPAFAAVDETQELAHTGIVVAIFEDARFVAGDSALAFVPPGECLDQGLLRACAVHVSPWVAVAARNRELMREHREMTSRAALIVVMLTSLLSTGVGLTLAYKAVKPLDALARAVQRVPEHAPADADLGLDDGIVEVDALRHTLQSAFDRLGRALTQSRSFAGNAAHQLRTPLTAIIGELDLALESAGASGADEIMRARRVAARLSILIDRLLILAGTDDTLRIAALLSLLDIVEDALDTLPESSRARIDYRGELVQIRADPALLVSAIVSALENSLKFSSGRVRVEISTREACAVLAVEDDGPGIAQSEQQDVFAPFYRGKSGNAGHIPGHGIGLAVIARVAAVHGGTARFIERAVGTRLEMSFPLG
jgi:signal transduction histidine kinase